MEEMEGGEEGKEKGRREGGKGGRRREGEEKGRKERREEGKEETYSCVTLTPPCSPLENTPFPLPPARICAFNTASRTPGQYDKMMSSDIW